MNWIFFEEPVDCHVWRFFFLIFAVICFVFVFVLCRNTILRTRNLRGKQGRGSMG